MAGLKGSENKLVSESPLGMKQRLSLASSMIHDPELVFLDEPTSGINSISRKTFWDFIYETAESGTTVFVTTHYLDEAEHCERISLMSEGKIIATGSPDEIKKAQENVHLIKTSEPEAVLSYLLAKNLIEEGVVTAEGVRIIISERSHFT